ncbi:hypothetical protein PL498_12915, partial [Bacteroides xylanisolvens]|nr:hypothetical protein [Bacteroides xylanisolvens]
MIRSFFVPFHFQLLFSFASHLNCIVSSFEFLLGQFGLSLKTWGIALKFLFLHHENILFPND